MDGQNTNARGQKHYSSVGGCTGGWLVSGKGLGGAALGQADMSLIFVLCGAISWDPLLLASSFVLLTLPLPQTEQGEGVIGDAHAFK